MGLLTCDIATRVSENRVVGLLRQLISFRSVNPPGGEQEIACFVGGLLRSAEFDVSLRDVEPKRPNVVARLVTGRPGPTLLFNTHMDVVPEGSGWASDPFVARREGGRIYGRGSVDAKGSLAAMIVALEAISELRGQLRGEIVLAAVADEEEGSGGTRSLLSDLPADMAVVGEPTACRVCTAHKGTAKVQLVVRGKAGHASNPRSGSNAIEGAVRIMERLSEYGKVLRSRSHPLVGSPSVTVTVIKGGMKAGIIPDTCEMTLFRTLIPGESESTVAAELEQTLLPLRQRPEPVDVEIFGFLRSSGGPSETPATDRIVRLVCRCAKEITGEEQRISGFPLNCDMAQLRGVAGIPTIILGPGDTEVAHQANEYVTIEDLTRAARIYARLALLSNGI